MLIARTGNRITSTVIRVVGKTYFKDFIAKREIYSFLFLLSAIFRRRFLGLGYWCFLWEKNLLFLQLFTVFSILAVRSVVFVSLKTVAPVLEKG